MAYFFASFRLALLMKVLLIEKACNAIICHLWAGGRVERKQNSLSLGLTCSYKESHEYERLDGTE